jgi:hypothetical protein
MDDKDAIKDEIIEAQKLLIESLELAVKVADERNEIQRCRISARDEQIDLLKGMVELSQQAVTLLKS